MTFNLLRLGTAVVVLMAGASIASGQALDCDAVLEADGKGADAGASRYQARSSDRCEGTIREVQAGGAGVTVATLLILPRTNLSGLPVAALSRTAELPISAQASVTITERTSRHFYRLDVSLDNAATARWPLDEVARPLGVEMLSISAIGRIVDSANLGPTIFFPVALHAPDVSAPTAQSDVLAQFYLSAPARSVSAHLGEYSTPGECQATDQLASWSTVSTGTALDVVIPASAPRQFCIEMVFSTKNRDGKFVGDQEELFFRK